MKTTQRTTSIRAIQAFLVALIAMVATLCAAQPSNNPPPPQRARVASLRSQTAARITTPSLRRNPAKGERVLNEIGPDRKVWISSWTNTTSQRTPATERGRRGAARIEQIATGMNYWNGESWVPSEPCFEISGNSFVAERMQQKVRIEANNLNVAGAVTLVTPDGIILRSTPVAIGLYDAASGESVILAGVRDCQGILVSSNAVLFQHAFSDNGVSADVLYTVEKGSFEQDIIFRKPLNVTSYEFPEKTTRIQIFSEFYGTPEPEKTVRPIRVEKDRATRERMVTPDLVDHTIGFGQFVIATGRARRAGANVTSSEAAAPIVKEFRVLQGRNFLIESVEYASVRSELASLGSSPTKTELAQLSRIRGTVGEKVLPSARSIEQAKTWQRTIPLIAQASDINQPGLLLDYVGTIGGTMSSTITFRGDTTYFVEAPVYCNGSVSLEGGAIFKFPNSTGNNPTTAYIKVSSALVCKTGAYRPAIFTAGDDDSVGESLWEVWDGYTGNTLDQSNQQQKYYGNPALWLYYGSTPTLENLRFSYCQEALRIEDHLASNEHAVSHSQFVRCIRGIVLTGDGSGSGGGSTAIPLSANNLLMADVQYPFTVNAPASGNLVYHSTIHDCTRLVTATASSDFYFRNSILADVPAPLYTGAVNISGNYNGFYPGSNPKFGSNQKLDDEFPFAPTGYIEDGEVYIWFANGQGAYYLREASPFFEEALAQIPASLTAALAQRTTIPPTVFAEDVNFSKTLRPALIADTGKLDLGYHYPVVDYAIHGATVNNCTLRIEQGTVIGLFGWPISEGGLPWGFRLNPGGRLNVTGVPTNRVVFTHMEAVQEMPVYAMNPVGPMITWRGLFFGEAFATPYPEAIFHYADFPTISGGWNGHFDASSLGPPTSTYSVVGHLELNGCLLQGGWLAYDAGGSQGRKVTIRNTVLERTAAIMGNWGGYQMSYGLPANDAQVNAANNLFYNCYMELFPISGNNWTFVDNIFDHVTFSQDQFGYPMNGDVGVNHHNVYVGMGGARLSPAAPVSTDPDITALAYVTGALGRFYVPGSTSIVNKGSRTASAAGLYHFTTSTGNVKEATSQVDVGPHYLALVSGRAADLNADGVPDFLADHNGDGDESNEMPWQSASSGMLSVLSPPGGAVVSGIVSFNVSLGAPASQVLAISIVIDGNTSAESMGVTRPGESLALLEIDSRRLENGQHSVTIYEDRLMGDGSRVRNHSPTMLIDVSNPIGFAGWERNAGEAMTVDVQCPVTLPNFTLWCFTADYPKSDDPFAPGIQTFIYDDISTGGRINSTIDVNWVTDMDDSVVYTFAELRSGGGPTTGNTIQTTPPIVVPPFFPQVGKWVVAYDQNVSDFHLDVHNKILDPEDRRNGMIPGEQRFPLWYHDKVAGHIGAQEIGNMGWLSCASKSGTEPLARTALANETDKKGQGQTFPKRIVQQSYTKDKELLGRFLQVKSALNFFGNGHGLPTSFMDFTASDFKSLNLKRYRFVFLDGCLTATDSEVLRAFGAQSFEFRRPGEANLLVENYSDFSVNRNRVRPGAFLGWISEVPAAFRLPQPQDGCLYQHFTSRGNWHDQLLFKWRDSGWTIKQAVDAANLTAHLSFDAAENGKAWTTMPVSAPDENGTIPASEFPNRRFTPGDFIRIYGATDLRFNQFNTSAEQWPPAQ